MLATIIASLNWIVWGSNILCKDSTSISNATTAKATALLKPPRAFTLPVPNENAGL